MGSVQNFILLFCVWCESREFGSRRSSRFCCITTMVETFSDRVPLKIPMNISYGALLQTYPTTLNLISRCWPFSCSNWHLSSFLSVIYFPFFRRKWIFFVLSFIWHSLNLSISFCRNFTVTLYSKPWKTSNFDMCILNFIYTYHFRFIKKNIYHLKRDWPYFRLLKFSRKYLRSLKCLKHICLKNSCERVQL